MFENFIQLPESSDLYTDISTKQGSEKFSVECNGDALHILFSPPISVMLSPPSTKNKSSLELVRNLTLPFPYQHLSLSVALIGKPSKVTFPIRSKTR